ncbi:glycosyltransferase [Rhodospirillaceae bacterium KN72]|uniref:Glycosyltransferase n=2 Tax=Pacificispira spongiicola TaxID=2729598 RepID=A0A7Y0E2A8_9PROT|nr:glycosyltransferase [Pacificispira spongiicola]
MSDPNSRQSTPPDTPPDSSAEDSVDGPEPASSQPKVLQVMAGAETGGAEAFFTRLTCALTRAGQDQQAVIRTHPARRAALEEAGVPVTELPFGGKFDLRTKKSLKKIAKAFDPDIVLVWMNRAAKVAPKGDWTVVGRLGGYYKLKNYKRCDHLIANTQDIRDYLLREGWPAERAWYLPNFVDDRRMPPVDRASLDTPEGVPLLLCLGRLHVNKGFDTALETLAKLPEAYLWIAGEGREESALKELAGRLGVAHRVRFLGWRDDAPALLAAADVFFCSSRHEPLGNIVLEAWAQGVPIVAAASQGPSQLIKDGKTGLLAPVDNPDALAKAFRRLLDDRALGHDMAGQAHEQFTQHFSEGPVVAAYQRFFDAVARKR